MKYVHEKHGIITFLIEYSTEGQLNVLLSVIASYECIRQVQQLPHHFFD